MTTWHGALRAGRGGPCRGRGLRRVRVERARLGGPTLVRLPASTRRARPRGMGLRGGGRRRSRRRTSAGPVTGSRSCSTTPSVRPSTCPPRRSSCSPTPSADQPFPGEAIGSAVNVARRSGFGSGSDGGGRRSGVPRCSRRRPRRSRAAPVSSLSPGGPVLLEIARRDGRERARDLSPPVTMPCREWTISPAASCATSWWRPSGHRSRSTSPGRLTKVRGRMVIAGFHQDGPRTADIQLWNWRGIDIVNAHERDDGTAARGHQAGGRPSSRVASSTRRLSTPTAFPSTGSAMRWMR